jgi:hypothetical protein
MAYTPELNYEASCNLRRLAWAMGMPMTVALDRIVDKIACLVDHKLVCQACKKPLNCKQCFFRQV